MIRDLAEIESVVRENYFLEYAIWEMTKTSHVIREFMKKNSP